MSRNAYYLVEEEHVAPAVRTDTSFLPARVFPYAIRRTADNSLVFRFENSIDAFGTLDRLNNASVEVAA